MSKCQSCGGANPPQATRCEYCDQPLGNKKLLEVAWSARTTRGATGEGQVKVLAPTDANPERVRALVQAAFSSSVDALGGDATAQELQADMEPRLRALLPDDTPLSGLEVTAFSAFVLVAGTPKAQAPADPPQASGGLRTALGVAFMASLCCMASGPLCIVTGHMAQKELEYVSTAKVVPADKIPLVAAMNSQGPICVEGAVAQVDSGIVVPGVPVEAGGPAEDLICLFVSKKVLKSRRPGGPARKEVDTQSVSSFRIGEFEVKTAQGSNMSWLGQETFERRVSDLETHQFSVIRAAGPVTVVGTLHGKVLEGRAGERLYVSGSPSQAGVRRELQLQASAGTELGYIALVLGGLLALLTFFFRRRA